MKYLILIVFLFFGQQSFFDDLFCGLKFDNQGKAYKKNVFVKYTSIGKATGTKEIESLQKGFYSTTSLSFSYNNKDYYLPIEEKYFPENFTQKFIEGDSILIDIVVFNKDFKKNDQLETKPCSYINGVRKKTKKNSKKTIATKRKNSNFVPRYETLR